MDNAMNQSAVAYASSPKEENTKPSMDDGNKQFGKNKMPQDSKVATKGYVKKVMKEHVNTMHRHKEHR